MINIKYIVTIVILACILFLSCRNAETPDGGKKQLIYWPAANAQEISLAQQAADIWNKSHPNIPVVVQPIPESQSTEEVLLAAVVGKTTPDICSNIWPGIVGQFVRAKALVALDLFSDFDSVAVTRLPQEQLATCRHNDGHVYQMPWKTNPIMLEYNINMLKKAGYDKPPATYSEFIEMGKKITSDNNGDGQNDQWMMYVDVNMKWWLRYFDFYTFYIAASGGETLIRDRQIVFENQAAIQVMQFFQECFQLKIFPMARFQNDTFLGGLVATHVTGPWNIDHLNKFKNDDLEFDYATIPIPDSATGPVMTYGDPKNIAIFSTTQYPQQAWEFVKLLVSVQQDFKLLQIASQIPIRKDLFAVPEFTAYFKEHPKMARFAEQAPYTRGVDTDPELREIFDTIAEEFEACCILGRRTPEEAVRIAAERSRETLR